MPVFVREIKIRTIGTGDPFKYDVEICMTDGTVEKFPEYDVDQLPKVIKVIVDGNADMFLTQLEQMRSAK